MRHRTRRCSKAGRRRSRSTRRRARTRRSRGGVGFGQTLRNVGSYFSSSASSKPTIPVYAPTTAPAARTWFGSTADQIDRTAALAKDRELGRQFVNTGYTEPAAEPTSMARGWFTPTTEQMKHAVAVADADAETASLTATDSNSTGAVSADDIDLFDPSDANTPDRKRAFDGDDASGNKRARTASHKLVRRKTKRVRGPILDPLNPVYKPRPLTEKMLRRRWPVHETDFESASAMGESAFDERSVVGESAFDDKSVVGESVFDDESVVGEDMFSADDASLDYDSYPEGDFGLRPLDKTKNLLQGSQNNWPTKSDSSPDPYNTKYTHKPSGWWPVFKHTARTHVDGDGIINKPSGKTGGTSRRRSRRHSHRRSRRRSRRRSHRRSHRRDR